MKKFNLFGWMFSVHPLGFHLPEEQAIALLGRHNFANYEIGDKVKVFYRDILPEPVRMYSGDADRQGGMKTRDACFIAVKTGEATVEVMKIWPGNPVFWARRISRLDFAQRGPEEELLLDLIGSPKEDADTWECVKVLEEYTPDQYFFVKAANWEALQGLERGENKELGISWAWQNGRLYAVADRDAWHVVYEFCR